MYKDPPTQLRISYVKSCGLKSSFILIPGKEKMTFFTEFPYFIFPSLVNNKIYIPLPPLNNEIR